MASQLDVVRALKIKTNTLKRLQKELSYYESEREREAARVEKMKADGADEHDLRQAVGVCCVCACTRL
jgi:tubulin-specific chaperone A